MSRIFRIAGLSILCMPICYALGGEVADRPNIVMIFSDDQRFDAVGYTGNEAIQTPNLDHLARSALVFTNCFVNTSICAVNRANVLTGQYPARHGIDDFHKTFTSVQLEESVPGRLQAAGYQTAFFGKWGVGDSPENTHAGAAVFDYWAGQPKQTNYFHESDCRYVNFNGFTRPLDDLCDCPEDSRGTAGHEVRIGRENLVDPIHVDSQVTPLHVQRFLDGRDQSRPFCMLLFFKSPHGPMGDWDPALADAIDSSKIMLPAAATSANAQREPDIVKESLGWSPERLENPGQFTRHIEDYYRSIASMDLGVGRVMDQLKQRGLAENTVVLFTSDNGYFTGEHGLKGKWLMYEPSLRVPGFLYDPRVNRGQSSDRLIITTDFSVTMLALAGIDVPESMTGRNLSILITNPEADWRQDFFYDHPYGHGGRIPRTLGVRNLTYSYTRYIDPSPPFEQLFDLQVDPDQLNNLIENSEYSDLLDELRKRCDQLAAEVGPIP